MSGDSNASNASTSPTLSEPGSAVASRLVVVGIVLAAVALLGYFAFGMPGMDMEGAATNGRGVDVADFEARMAAGNAVVINVHVPYAGEIDGTDLLIPLDQVGDSPQLPADRDAPILLYCRTGRMSQEAADALVAAGYTDVVQLDGGMVAWEAAGRDLVSR